MFNFEPEFTPLGTSVLTSFQIRDKMYVVDMYGQLFQLLIEGDDPDMWCWIEVIQL